MRGSSEESRPMAAPFPSRSRRLIVRVLALVLASSAFLLSQQSSNQKSNSPTPSTPLTTPLTQGQPIPDKLQPHPDESAAANTSLVQLNNALEGLAAKVSPAVVQILVDGYGRAPEENRAQTALIVRQHAVGSGVIVDSSGYIMTNAHVVEGAQSIHVALAMPSVSFPDQIAPVGKQRVVQARLIGLHRETDLALIKIDQTELPTLSLG